MASCVSSSVCWSVQLCSVACAVSGSQPLFAASALSARALNVSQPSVYALDCGGLRDGVGQPA